MGGFSLSKIKLPQLKLLSAKKEQFPVGLDIGSHSIKICQVVKSGDDFKLLNLGSSKLPEGAVEDGILQEPEEVANIINSLFKNLKLKEKRVAISISGYSFHLILKMFFLIIRTCIPTRKIMTAQMLCWLQPKKKLLRDTCPCSSLPV
jgi:mRNA-degrading endonuclease HigB of HigAB toxin-antitoxin module